MVTLIRGIDNVRIFPVQVLNRSNKNPNIVRFNDLEITIKAISALEHYGIQSFTFLIVPCPLEYVGNWRRQVFHVNMMQCEK